MILRDLALRAIFAFNVFESVKKDLLAIDFFFSFAIGVIGAIEILGVGQGEGGSSFVVGFIVESG